MASNLVVITAFSDTSDIQPWGFKYLQNLLRRSVDSIICHSCPSSLPRLALLRRMGGASGSCLSWTVEGSRPGILRSGDQIHGICQDPWKSSRLGDFMVRWYQRLFFGRHSDAQLFRLSKNTRWVGHSQPSDIPTCGTYGCSWPDADVVRLRSEPERSGSKLPGVLISLQVYYPPNRSTNLVQLFGVGFPFLSFLVVVQLISFKYHLIS